MGCRIIGLVLALPLTRNLPLALFIVWINIHDLPPNRFINVGQGLFQTILDQ